MMRGVIAPCSMPNEARGMRKQRECDCQTARNVDQRLADPRVPSVLGYSGNAGTPFRVQPSAAKSTRSFEIPNKTVPTTKTTHRRLILVNRLIDQRGEKPKILARDNNPDFDKIDHDSITQDFLL
jgi:hypothetical protein